MAEYPGVLIMRKDYDIVGSYDNQRISTINAERTINMFEYVDEQAKRPKVLVGTSGLENANIDFGMEQGGSRASLVFKDAIYTVYGSTVFRTSGTTGALLTTKIGDVNAGSTGYVGIDANAYQVIIVDGTGGWIYDTLHLTYEPITDTGFPAKPIDVCFLDGFFVVANGETNSFQLSLINNGMVWSGGTKFAFTAAIGDTLILTTTTTANFATGVPVTLDKTGAGAFPTAATGDPLNNTTTYYAIRVTSAATNPGQIKIARTQADAFAGTAISYSAASVAPVTIKVAAQLQQGSITSHPGTIVACRTLHRRLFLFSQNFTEVWENAGLGTNLPFRRNNSLLMEVGTPSVGSIATGFDRMFFLSQDRDGLGSVMGVSGTQSAPVSNRALDYALAQYATDPTKGVADSRGIMIKENGIIFYRLNFTKANHTYVYSVSMSTESDPKWHEEEVLNGDRHPAQTHVYYKGVNYYGHYNQPILYIVDDKYTTNNGEPIRRMRIGRQVTPEGYNRLRIDRWHIDVLQGKTDQFVTDVANLDAENTQNILTEDGIDLLLDQQVIIGSGAPKIFLSISKDGGQSYGYSTSSNMGKLGERTYRTVWRKLGTTPRGQGFTPKIEFFNTVPFYILGAAWDFEILPE